MRETQHIAPSLQARPVLANIVVLRDLNPRPRYTKPGLEPLRHTEVDIHKGLELIYKLHVPHLPCGKAKGSIRMLRQYAPFSMYVMQAAAVRT